MRFVANLNRKMKVNMEIYDAHIHTHGKPCDPPEVFLEKAHSCGVTGGTIFSVHPAKYRPFPNYDQRAESRIDWIVEYTSHTPGFLPYFFADLSEPDAMRHVDYAVKAGIRGFKVICDGEYSVKDHKDVVEAMAETGLPVMFHAGVDNIPHYSSFNNRPIMFECLMKIKGLRFSLAHMAWPWCDEFVGIFGKIEMARGGGNPADFAEMFVDVTPGTPGIYRREALRKLYLTGYDSPGHTFWGTDQVLNDYNADTVRMMLKRDNAILEEIEADYQRGDVVDPAWLPKLENLKPLIYSDIWRRFNNLV